MLYFDYGNFKLSYLEIKMNILSFDSSAAACSVALSNITEIFACDFKKMSRGQAEYLMPMIKKTLMKSGLRPCDIDMVAVTIGPGAFTGIRIGLASANAFGLALNIPVVGITTTRAVAMAQDNPQGKDILVAIDSKRADIYMEILSPNGISKMQPKLLSLDDIVKFIANDSDLLICGDAIPRLLPILAAAEINYIHAWQENIFPDPAVIAKLATEDFIKYGAMAFENKPKPLYIRPPDASLPKSTPSIIVN